MLKAIYVPHRIRIGIGNRVTLDDSTQPPFGITPEEWSFIVNQAGAENALVDQIQECRQQLVPPEYEWDEDANRIAREEERPYLTSASAILHLTLPRAHYYYGVMKKTVEGANSSAADPARSNLQGSRWELSKENLR